jgi:hypothetical protein
MSPVAVVFVRRTGADGLGHVGWAFTDGADTFSVGSVENPHHSLRTPPEQMGFWVMRTRDPIAPMRVRAYTELKVIDLAQSDPMYAWQVVTWHRHRPYDIIGCNCMDVTYDILRAFGVPKLPVPAYHWEPNHWFDHVQGQRYQIDQDDAVIQLMRQGRAASSPALPDRDGLIVNQLRNRATAIPAWRTAHTPEWDVFQADLAAATAARASAAIVAQYHGIIGWMRDLFGIASRQ